MCLININLLTHYLFEYFLKSSFMVQSTSALERVTVLTLVDETVFLDVTGTSSKGLSALSPMPRLPKKNSKDQCTKWLSYDIKRIAQLLWHLW